MKKQIYFDMWLEKILLKNEMRRLLINKDPELGFDEETKFKIDEKTNLDFKMVDATIKYEKETKSLNIYLRAFNVNNGSDYRFKQLPESVSGGICDNIMYLLAENSLLSNGVRFDATINYIDFINFYFIFDENEMASGEPVGGIIYKRNKEKDLFSFDFLKSFNDADFS
jgi:hypothetical protein